MKALVLAGGLPQIALIKELKNRRIYTILADGSNNAIARPYADQFFCIPIFDIQAVSELAIREKVDFIITACADQVLLVVAKVSEMLGLPCYLDYNTAKQVSDKAMMKEVFVQNSIPTSRYTVMGQYAEDRIKDLSYPLIVKPVDFYSSKGVRKVFNENELKRAFDDAVRMSRSSTAIVEEFCAGDEISVDVYVENGLAHILCVSNSEKLKDEDRFIIFRGRYPADITENTSKRIRSVAQGIADAFHITNAPMLIQMIVNEDKLFVLEFCARTGGAMKYLLIQHVCGFDAIGSVVDLTMGIKPRVAIREPENRYIVNDFMYCEAGTFSHLSGFEELKNAGIISEYYALKSTGTTFTGVTSSSDRVAGVTIQADSIDEFNRKHRIMVDSVRVLDHNGKDIMRHDLLPGLA